MEANGTTKEQISKILNENVPKVFYCLNGYCQNAICLEENLHTFSVFETVKNNKYNYIEHKTLKDAAFDIFARTATSKQQEEKMKRELLSDCEVPY